MTPNLSMARRARLRGRCRAEISSPGMAGDDLAVLVDDLPGGDGGGRPAPRHVSLVGAEVDGRVQRGQVDLHLALEIDDDQIGVGTDLERTLPRMEPEETGGMVRGQPHDVRHREATAVDTLREQDGKDHRAAGADRGAW